MPKSRATSIAALAALSAICTGQMLAQAQGASANLASANATASALLKTADPSASYNAAAKTARGAIADYLQSSSWLLAQQETDGCQKLDAAVHSAERVQQFIVEIASAAGTEVAAQAAIQAQTDTASIGSVLCGGQSEIGINCTEQSCTKEKSEAAKLLGSAAQKTKNARLLAASSSSAQGNNTMQTAASMTNFASRPTATAAAAAALFQNRAAQWFVQARACTQSAVAAQQAEDAAKLASKALATADRGQEDYRNIVDDAKAASASTAAASYAARRCK